MKSQTLSVLLILPTPDYFACRYFAFRCKVTNVESLDVHSITPGFKSFVVYKENQFFFFECAFELPGKPNLS